MSDLSTAPQAVAIKMGGMLFSSGTLLTLTNLHVHVCWIVLIDYSMILCSFYFRLIPYSHYILLLHPYYTFDKVIYLTCSCLYFIIAST